MREMKTVSKRILLSFGVFRRAKTGARNVLKWKMTLRTKHRAYLLSKKVPSVLCASREAKPTAFFRTFDCTAIKVGTKQRLGEKQAQELP